MKLYKYFIPLLQKELKNRLCLLLFPNLFNINWESVLPAHLWDLSEDSPFLSVLLYLVVQGLAAINAERQELWPVDRDAGQQICSSPGQVCQFALAPGVEWIQAEAASGQWDSNMGSGSSSGNRWEQNKTHGQET